MQIQVAERRLDPGSNPAWGEIIPAIIPLRAKRVGEFIEIRHKNISPTRILGTLGRHSVTLSLCLQ